jgi:deoxyribonuclease V
MPYLPGLLSFREAPLLLDALRRLEGDPDLLLVDGHGRAHPRGLGIASHLGLHLEIPVVGVGKSLLVGEFASPGVGRGDSAPIRYGGRTNGRAVRTRAGVKPVFVSVGNRISLPSAVRAVLATASRFRLPEPIRHADRESRRHARAPAPSAAPPIAPSRGGVAGRTRCWTA